MAGSGRKGGLKTKRIGSESEQNNNREREEKETKHP